MKTRSTYPITKDLGESAASVFRVKWRKYMAFDWKQGLLSKHWPSGTRIHDFISQQSTA
jgi:hypothetical protein